MDDDADGQAEEAVDLAHPLGVALGEIVVDGNDVDAAAGEGVEVAGKRGDEGLAFAGLHLGDLAGVEDGAADQLDIEVAHANDAFASLADDSEGLGQELVEDHLFRGVDGVVVVVSLLKGGGRKVSRGGDLGDGGGDALTELDGLGPKLLVGERLDRGFKSTDLLYNRKQTLHGAFIAGTEDLGDGGIKQDVWCPSGYEVRPIPSVNARANPVLTLWWLTPAGERPYLARSAWKRSRT